MGSPTRMRDRSSMQSPDHMPRGSARLRLGRHSETGRVYLVTFHTFDREPIFKNWSDAVTMVRASMSPHVLRSSRVLCWVLMPDHWHGLVDLGEMDELSQLVGRIKGVSARAVNLHRAQAGHVWGPGFHDHALRDEGFILDMARYIVMNPVRAGLVERVGLYPFWDALWLDGECRNRACPDPVQGSLPPAGEIATTNP
jgi:putative transposase